jgi:hypothetical protein
MYERHDEPLLPRRKFVLRVLRGLALGVAVVAFSLTMGACGYHFLEELPWLDATLNASMILTGMGPVDPVRSTGGKVFAIGFSLYSGVVFLGVGALVLAPIIHRILHHFRLAEEDMDKDDGARD